MTDTLALMAAGFMHAISPINLLAMLASTIVGITIGCLPGLSAAMGVALLLPVTFGMDPATGLIVLGGIYCGAIFGGSISAILIHTPGTPASAATAIEGYQLTLRGKAAKALFTACFASFCGGLIEERTLDNDLGGKGARDGLSLPLAVEDRCAEKRHAIIDHD